jgi:molybdate transport system substrate-binding protein
MLLLPTNTQHYSGTFCRCHLKKTMHLLIFLILFLFHLPATADTPPLIAVASNLRPAMQKISQAFKQKTGISLRISYASSGILSQQIIQGAPFELFISANQRFVNRLPDSLVKQQHVLVLGQLALLAPFSGIKTLTPDLQDLSIALKNHHIRHFVIANPEHAPFGIASRQVLQRQHLWQPLQPFLIRAENAAQAVQFIASGIADAGLVPYSLALNPGLRKTTRHILLSKALQPRLPQTIVLLGTASKNTQLLYDFMQQPVSLNILKQYGYQLPQKETNGLDRF